MFEDILRVTALNLIPARKFTPQVKHELHEPQEKCLQMPHHCDATVFGEASPWFHAHCTAPGQTDPDEIVKPQISTVQLEPGIVETSALGTLVGANYRMFTPVLVTWQVELLQSLLKTY